MTPFGTLWHILLPQAITLMLPSIISQLVVILKDSALGFLILYEELIRSGQTLASSKGNLIPTFFVIAVIFIVVNYTLTWRLGGWNVACRGQARYQAAA